MAPVGHSFTHLRHSLHFCGSTHRRGYFSTVIASNAHTFTHLPQPCMTRYTSSPGPCRPSSPRPLIMTTARGSLHQLDDHLRTRLHAGRRTSSIGVDLREPRWINHEWRRRRRPRRTVMKPNRGSRNSRPVSELTERHEFGPVIIVGCLGFVFARTATTDGRHLGLLLRQRLFRGMCHCFHGNINVAATHRAEGMS